jgi:hypothetical protein
MHFGLSATSVAELTRDAPLDLAESCWVQRWVGRGQCCRVGRTQGLNAIHLHFWDVNSVPSRIPESAGSLSASLGARVRVVGVRPSPETAERGPERSRPRASRWARGAPPAAGFISADIETYTRLNSMICSSTTPTLLQQSEMRRNRNTALSVAFKCKPID